MIAVIDARLQLRNRLSERAGALANQAKEGYRKATHNAGHWAEKGKEAPLTALRIIRI